MADALPPADAETQEIPAFCTRRYREVPPAVERGKTGAELFDLVIREFAGTTDSCCQQVTPHLPVLFDIHEAEDKPAGEGGDAVTDSPDLLQQVADRYPVRQDKRIEPPDNPAPADTTGEPDKGIDTFVERRDARLEPLSIVIVQGLQKVIPVPLFIKRIEIRQEWQRVLGPEDKNPGLFKGDVNGISPEGALPPHISLMETRQEPLPVESRDIR